MTERKRRIDAKKQLIREERARRQKQVEEIGEIIKWGGIGLTFIGFVALVIYVMIILMKPFGVADECQDFKTDVFICLNEGADWDLCTIW